MSALDKAWKVERDVSCRPSWSSGSAGRNMGCCCCRHPLSQSPLQICMPPLPTFQKAAAPLQWETADNDVAYASATHTLKCQTGFQRVSKKANSRGKTRAKNQDKEREPNKANALPAVTLRPPRSMKPPSHTFHGPCAVAWWTLSSLPPPVFFFYFFFPFPKNSRFLLIRRLAASWRLRPPRAI